MTVAWQLLLLMGNFSQPKPQFERKIYLAMVLQLVCVRVRVRYVRACLFTGICSQQSALGGLIRCEEVGCKGPLFQAYP